MTTSINELININEVLSKTNDVPFRNALRIIYAKKFIEGNSHLSVRRSLIKYIKRKYSNALDVVTDKNHQILKDKIDFKKNLIDLLKKQINNYKIIQKTEYSFNLKMINYVDRSINRILESKWCKYFLKKIESLCSLNINDLYFKLSLQLFPFSTDSVTGNFKDYFNYKYISTNLINIAIKDFVTETSPLYNDIKDLRQIVHIANKFLIKGILAFKHYPNRDFYPIDFKAQEKDVLNYTFYENIKEIINIDLNQLSFNKLITSLKMLKYNNKSFPQTYDPYSINEALIAYDDLISKPSEEHSDDLVKYHIKSLMVCQLLGTYLLFLVNSIDFNNIDYSNSNQRKGLLYFLIFFEIEESKFRGNELYEYYLNKLLLILAILTKAQINFMRYKLSSSKRINSMDLMLLGNLVGMIASHKFDKSPFKQQHADILIRRDIMNEFWQTEEIKKINKIKEELLEEALECARKKWEQGETAYHDEMAKWILDRLTNNYGTEISERTYVGKRPFYYITYKLIKKKITPLAKEIGKYKAPRKYKLPKEIFGEM